MGPEFLYPMTIEFNVNKNPPAMSQIQNERARLTYFKEIEHQRWKSTILFAMTFSFALLIITAALYLIVTGHSMLFISAVALSLCLSFLSFSMIDFASNIKARWYLTFGPLLTAIMAFHLIQYRDNFQLELFFAFAALISQFFCAMSIIGISNKHQITMAKIDASLHALEFFDKDQLALMQNLLKHHLVSYYRLQVGQLNRPFVNAEIAHFQSEIARYISSHDELEDPLIAANFRQITAA